MNATEALAAITHGQAHLRVLAELFRHGGWVQQADALEAQAESLSQVAAVLEPVGDPHNVTEGGRLDRLEPGDLERLYAGTIAQRG